MKNLTYSIVGLYFIVFITSCAATYQPPSIQPQNIVETVQASASDVFRISKQVLIMEGYQILNSDENSGTISTTSRKMKLDETQCDCGTTMGLPYIKDNRTITTVSLGLLINDNRISIKATIEGEYLKGDAVQGVSMECVSTGTIERALIEKIKSQL